MTAPTPVDALIARLREIPITDTYWNTKYRDASIPVPVGTTAHEAAALASQQERIADLSQQLDGERHFHPMLIDAEARIAELERPGAYITMVEHEAALRQAEADARRYRDALKELVACKDLKEADERKLKMTEVTERARMDYERRKGPAWADARAALDAAQPGGEKDGPMTPAAPKGAAMLTETDREAIERIYIATTSLTGAMRDERIAEHFLAEGARRMQERCAKVCEKLGQRLADDYMHTESDTGAHVWERDEYWMMAETTDDCAAAIRAIEP